MRSIHSLVIAAFCASPVFAADLIYTTGGKSYSLKDYTFGGVPGRLYVPTTYNPSNEMPLVTFLHGLGEAGTNNSSQINGNMSNLLVNAENRGFLLFAPQSWNGWWGDVDTVTKAIGQVTIDYSVNHNKVYMTGLSAGGGGTMDLMRRYSGVFAGFVPLSVNATFSTPADAMPVVGKPTWYFTGFNDGPSYRNNSRTALTNQCIAAGVPSPQLPVYPATATTYNYTSPNGLHRYTEYANGGHDNVVWNNGAYNNSTMYTWLLGQSNSLAAPTTAVRLAFGSPAPDRTDSAGRHWNIADQYIIEQNPNDTGALQTFSLDQSGVRTPVLFEVTKTFNRESTASTLPAGAPFDADIAAKYLYTASWAHPQAQLTIHGLESDTPYNLDIFSSVVTSAGDTRYRGLFSVGSTSLTIDAANNTGIYTLSSMFPNAGGDIVLDVTYASGSMYGVLNTLSVVPVPEPTSLALLGVTGFIVLRRRSEA